MQSDPEWVALLSWVFVCELGKLSGDRKLFQPESDLAQ